MSAYAKSFWPPLALGLMLILMSLSACNTMEGVGEDTQSAGRAIERSADRNK